MKISQVHPELQSAYRRIPAVPFHNKALLFVLNTFPALLPAAKPVEGVSVTDIELQDFSLRLYQHEGESASAGLLWIHGGGLIMGSPAMDDRECSLYARDLQLVVLSVDYRLAPRYPFPAAIDDCLAAWAWFQNQAARLGVDPDRIAISGRSAGGGLAASLAHRIYDQGGTQPAAQALFCPMLDDRTAAQRELDAVRHRLWNNKNNLGGWSYYLGHAPGAAVAPEYAVPARRENLSGLPPAWIGVGDIDLFFREDSEYAARLVEAGVACEFDVAPAAPHAFESLVPGAQVSRDFLEKNRRFLRDTLAL